MKKRLFLMLAAALTFSSAALLTSCSEKDKPVVPPETNKNPLAEQLVGTWYCTIDAAGTIGEGDDAQHYDKVVMILIWGGDNWWFRIPMNGDKPVVQDTDRFGGQFSCTAANDGTIAITMIHPFMGNPDIEKRVMYYTAGHLKGFNGYEDYDMMPATDEQKEYIQVVMEQIFVSGHEEGSIGDHAINDLVNPDGFKWEGNGLDDDDEER